MSAPLPRPLEGARGRLRAADPAASTDLYTTDNPEHLAYHERNRRRGRMAGQLRIRIRHGSRATPWFDNLLASPDELAELVNGTGWELARVIGEDQASYLGVLERAA